MSVYETLAAPFDAKETVLFDGIRHAAEICWFAFSRLDATLGWLVDTSTDDPLRSQMTTAAYMDAWSLVDAIDRFRSLWAIVPRDQPTKTPDIISFEELSAPVRRLRNVTDHLAQRIDYVAAHGNPVMGLLTWIALVPGSDDKVLSCMLAAGTMKKARWKFIHPFRRDNLIAPSGRIFDIHLAAGEHSASLSQLIPEMQIRIRQLESSLDAFVRDRGLQNQEAGADAFVVMEATLRTEPPTARSQTSDPQKKSDVPESPA